MPMNMRRCRLENTVEVIFNDGGDPSECEKKAYDQFLRLCAKLVDESWIEGRDD